MTIKRFVALGLLAFGSTACGGGSSGSGGGNGGGYPTTPPPQSCTPGNGTVCLTSGNTFNPSATTISRGATVVWNNASGVTHNVTFDAVAGAPANAPNFSSGTYSATFATAGTYPYHCTIHGQSMSGTVTVQ